MSINGTVFPSPQKYTGSGARALCRVRDLGKCSGLPSATCKRREEGKSYLLGGVGTRGWGTAKSAVAQSPGLERRETRDPAARAGSRGPRLPALPLLSPSSQPRSSSSSSPVPLLPRAPLREKPKAAGSRKRRRKKFPSSASSLS